jgi:ADP-ribosylglycohydrolase
VSTAIQRALRSLDGLSVGDAFGQCFTGVGAALALQERLPEPPWRWTDDTEMALSVVDQLLLAGTIDPGALAAGFVARFTPWRGYAAGAIGWVERVKAGVAWASAAGALFEGRGSYGNGGAMRAAPIGAFFHGDPVRAAEEARRSALVTHSHPEGQAGAIAVAVAASLAGQVAGANLLAEVATFTPPGEVRAGVLTAAALAPTDVDTAAARLGTGRAVSAQDTVPWSLFCAAHHAADFERALWTTARGLGDVDTTCAIVGGIVALTAPVPAGWLRAREPLPDLGIR